MATSSRLRRPRVAPRALHSRATDGVAEADRDRVEEAPPLLSPNVDRPWGSLVRRYLASAAPPGPAFHEALRLQVARVVQAPEDGVVVPYVQRRRRRKMLSEPPEVDKG